MMCVFLEYGLLLLDNIYRPQSTETMHLATSVCQSPLHAWTIWPRTLILCMWVDLEPDKPGIVGQVTERVLTSLLVTINPALR